MGKLSQSLLVRAMHAERKDKNRTPTAAVLGFWQNKSCSINRHDPGHRAERREKREDIRQEKERREKKKEKQKEKREKR